MGKAAKQSRGAAGPGVVRIVGGQWKRTLVPVVDRPGLRPSPDRVRETLYNWLGQDLSGWRVLDAYAGTGALGFEAASRGAQDVLLIERDVQAAKALEATRLRLGAQQLRVQVGDGLGYMQRAAPQSYDLILLDPPWDSSLLAPSVAAAARLLTPQGFVYVEAPTWPASAPAGWVIHRASRAGAVHFGLLRLADPAYTAGAAQPDASDSGPDSAAPVEQR